MRLLEYEAKQLLTSAGVPVPLGCTISEKTPQDVAFPVVLKSQVPIGGRGRLGGILFAETADEYAKGVARLLQHAIQGFTPKVLLIEEKLAIEREFYLSILIDREEGDIKLMAHASGGVEIESQHEGFLSLPISQDSLPSTAVAQALGIQDKETELHGLLTNLYQCFTANDATLIEINPLALTAAGQLVCSDAKVELDDAAAFRHDWHFETALSEANFVTLNPDGMVATIANGAGLAMATVDAVHDKGLQPANFLDIGGGANTASVLRAFRRIMEYPNIQAIIINIFAGITRCDEVAKAIVEARAQIPELPPLFIRLAGTNYQEAVDILEAEGIPLAATLEDCLRGAAREVTS